jgi:hypothetical protein
MSLVAAGGTHGFQLVDETYTTLDVPGSANTAVDGINDAGQIVGGYDGHGFLLDVDGSYITLDATGAEATRARGINNAGQIVGEYFDGMWHGFVLSDDGYTTLDVPVRSRPSPTGSMIPARSWGSIVRRMTTCTASSPSPNHPPDPQIKTTIGASGPAWLWSGMIAPARRQSGARPRFSVLARGVLQLGGQARLAAAADIQGEQSCKSPFYCWP